MKPRERLTKYGIENMTDLELVQLIVGSGVIGNDVAKIADEVLQRVASFLRLSISGSDEAGLDDAVFLKDIKGLGDVKRARLIAALELGKRLYEVQEARESARVQNSAQVVTLFKEIMQSDREKLAAVFLNGRLNIMGREVISVGASNRVAAQPVDLLVPCLKYSAGSMIICHNHPSGSLEPSHEDHLFTERLVQACELVGVKLLDHLIVNSKGQWKSIID